MANYAIDRKVVEPYLPYQTELDLWSDTCYMSLVGFMFLNTAVKGMKVLFHTKFEEVNLRFYVRYKENAVWKRGVVFIKEIVPRPMLTWVANTLYKEHYQTLPMAHAWTTEGDKLSVTYQWKQDRWHTFKVEAEAASQSIPESSEAEFITEHYWGYTRITEKRTSEYQVEHPRWQVYPVKEYFIGVDFGAVYVDEFAFLRQVKPESVFLAEGSEIVVREGKTI